MIQKWYNKRFIEKKKITDAFSKKQDFSYIALLLWYLDYIPDYIF